MSVFISQPDINAAGKAASSRKRKRNVIEDDDDDDGDNGDATPGAKKAKSDAGRVDVKPAIDVEELANKTTLTEDDILPSVPDRAEILTGDASLTH